MFQPAGPAHFNLLLPSSPTDHSHLVQVRVDGETLYEFDA